MEHKIKIEREMTITTEDVIDRVLACEAGGFDYWCEVCYDADDYTAAKARLIEKVERGEVKKPTFYPEICFEDVEAEILEGGGKLVIWDREEDKEHDLTLEKLIEGWRKYITDTGREDFDEYDADDADAIIQYAVFGEIIYG